MTMRAKRDRSKSYHLVTPEEPPRIKRRDGSAASNQNNDKNAYGHSEQGFGGSATPENESNFFMPSVKNTRDLETELLDTMHQLQQKTDSGAIPVDKEHLISLLNRSITALSHWSLQAQLVQLRGNVDDRQLVETNLLRREMELLVNRRSNGGIEEASRNKQPRQKKTTYMRSPPYAPSVSESSSPKRSARRHSTLSSPTSHTLDDPVSLKLVENNKPHPRMKRNSDNPSTNEYVRVFHLERE